MDVIKKCHFLLTKRGTKILGNEVWQTNWEDDRDWMLRPIANSDFVRKSLVVGSYEFVIGFQSICGRTLFYNEKAIAYIPNSCPIQPALQYGLELMANALNITNKQSGSKKSFIGMVEIKKIIDYAVEDLKTGKIFGENIEIAREMDLIEQKERMALN
jgi:hypothetical protein